MKIKKLLAVVLSTAIMLTFMPMMAFADAPAEVKAKAQFNGDYTKVTVAGYVDTETSEEVPQHTYNTVRTYDTNSGAIVVTADPASDVDWPVPQVATSYYDLSVAEFADANSRTLKAEYAFGSYTKGSFQYVKLNVPTYVVNKTAQAVFAPLAYLKANWAGKAVGDEEFDATVRAEQTFTISLEGTYDSQAQDDGIALVGTIPAKAVKVNAPTADPAQDAQYFFDNKDAGTTGTGASKTNPMAVYYDGEAHTFTASAVDGWTASYSVFDAQTGKWNPTTVTLSEIQKDPTYVKVDWTKAGATAPDKTKARYFYVNLKAAGDFVVGFIPGEEGFNGIVYSVPGSDYDAASYIDASGYVTYRKGMTDEQKAAAKLLDAATEKAVAKNKAALIAWFNELYEIKATVSKSNPNAVDLEIDTKDLTSKERTAIAEKYAATLACFDGFNIDPDEATVALNGVDLSDYEIEFTQAPAKKVIKTKKSKTTKKATIAIKAECKNGTVVKYKLINAPKKNITIDPNTGKITVKKGTPKGTYSFKIKAYIPGSYNYFDRTSVSEIQNIKVVVKKTKK